MEKVLDDEIVQLFVLRGIALALTYIKSPDLILFLQLLLFSLLLFFVVVVVVVLLPDIVPATGAAVQEVLDAAVPTHPAKCVCSL